MVNGQRMVKPAEVTPLNAHVYRVFNVFDRLYQFGATDYFARFQGVDEGYRIFSEALRGLTTEQVNLGIRRVEGLENRKLVFPEARAFFNLCIWNDQEFSEQLWRYEEKN
ncbi:hypothetical protein THMIRHAS_16550 [Thiosulfatimonas sediminis]|uniref:Uncharacterized protein n=1 Tax=Thiosulfatimonas sediminis TaxID=2675054 RepID=A0A6F8PVV6_9GAMM|nr:hypothetical protein [Thiosulfatimonas sediminis]BBP46282.1 hypothetical protein THMIRHAS_16550 [Thiosulfatimonas sediminis]